jgi:hypothetical protein
MDRFEIILSNDSVVTNRQQFADKASHKNDRSAYNEHSSSLRLTICCRGNAISITYSEYMFVALGVKHPKRMRRIVLPSVACLAPPYFFSPNYL